MCQVSGYERRYDCDGKLGQDIEGEGSNLLVAVTDRVVLGPAIPPASGHCSVGGKSVEYGY